MRYRWVGVASRAVNDLENEEGSVTVIIIYSGAGPSNVFCSHSAHLLKSGAGWDTDAI